MDRRRKNDEQRKRREVLDNYKQIKETRELVFAGTGYLTGAFNKQYGKIYVFTVEPITEQMRKQESEQLQYLEQNHQKPAVVGTSRQQYLQSKYCLNRVTQEELQNAVTAIVAEPRSKCVLVAEAKLVNGYYLTDGQKLEKCESQSGLLYVMSMTRFQDFLLITDAFHDSKLWIFRDRGKRLTEFSAKSKETQTLFSEFLINSYEEQLYCCYQFKNQIGIFNYRVESTKLNDRLQLQQIIQTPETAVKLLKIPTSCPEPSGDVRSSVATLHISMEGAILQLVPLPEKVLKLAHQEQTVLQVTRCVQYYDHEQQTGYQLSEKWNQIEDVDKIRLTGKAHATKGAW